jgi:hypothetical protein
VEVKERYQVKISNRFAALENLGDSWDVNRTWNNATQNINISDKKRVEVTTKRRSVNAV